MELKIKTADGGTFVIHVSETVRSCSVAYMIAADELYWRMLTTKPVPDL